MSRTESAAGPHDGDRTPRPDRTVPGRTGPGRTVVGRTVVGRTVVGETDPVAAFLAAHADGEPVALPTSGTTGAQRLVVRSTASWVDSFAAVADLTGLRTDSGVWVPGPLHATMNLFAAVHARHLGAVVVPTLAEASHAQLTPSRLRQVLDEEPGALAGRSIVVAGDALGPDLRERATRAGARVSHYYGAAELSFVAWGADTTDLRPFPGVEVELRDGAIWARSPYLAEGVSGGPGASLRRSPDGFGTVGDRGRWEDGRLRVTGRAYDVVLTGGATVLVADVEAALAPGLHGALAVVSLPHTGLGAVVGAVLTDPADRDRVRRTVRALDPAHQPRRWFHLADLPLTAAGKLDRATLARLVADPGVRILP